MRSRYPPLAAAAATLLAACAPASEASPPVAAPPNVPITVATTRAILSTPAPSTSTTEPSTTSSALATTTPTPTGDGRLTLAFTGDALWHSPLWRHAAGSFAAANPGGSGMDFRPMLSRLTPLIGAVDLGVCHLETPIAPEGEEFTTHPLYGVPPDVVPALVSAGFDRCSLASNHVIDRGVAGIDRTVSVLESHGLGHAGMARTPEEIEPRVFTVDGVVVSHLSYTYGYNGMHLPAGQDWRSALIDPVRIIADARQARSLGAEVVIVSMHWGVEGRHDVTADQRAAAQEITASGTVDLIVGHHAHVLQPIEQINGVWVIFGLGNMISNMPTGPYPPASQDGAVAIVDIAIGGDGWPVVGQPVIHPTWVDRDRGWIVHLVQRSLADPTTDPSIRAQLELSLTRTQQVLAGFIAA